MVVSGGWGEGGMWSYLMRMELSSGDQWCQFFHNNMNVLHATELYIL